MTRTTLQRVLPSAVGGGEEFPLVATGEGVSSTPDGVGVALAPGATASFGTYFGGFPGAWWRESSTLTAVTLEATVAGRATVRIHRSDASGHHEVVQERPAADGSVSLTVELPATDGGWVWCEVGADAAGAIVSDLRWTADDAPVRAATVTVAITTFDREEDCLGVLRALARDPDVTSAVERVVVVDQGTRRLRDAAGFADAAALLGDRLEVFEQPNLGGSGGFSRGMFAALAEESQFVLLLDDDIRLDPEALHRLLAFATRTRTPTIVGAHMLSLVEPTVLHSFGERVDRRTWLWRPAVPGLSSVDLRTVPLARPELHRRVDVDFNGWWMCLVPTELIREEGAALPLFIKWDDTEFALRAADAGVPTVTLPGAAVWHMPWTAKDDGLDWQAYFQLRNRLVTALLHGRRRETGVLLASLAQDVNHVLCLQYGSSAVRRAALRDVLSGPGHLASSALTARRDAGRILGRAGQTVVELKADGSSQGIPDRPRGPAGAGLRALRVLAHQLSPPRRRADARRLARSQGKWWAVGLQDAVAVESATGRGVFLGRRDRRIAVALVRDAVVVRVRLWLRWSRLAADYRAAAPRLAGETQWARLIEEAASGVVAPSSVD